jgi:NAD+--asparagine ADP-ribosyltransferase
MNGGMWGGVKSALPFMEERVTAWKSRDQYMADLHFLEDKIWPDIKHRQISHDSYCCDRYPNAKPFPTRRPPTYQHVGQVFDAEGNPRLMDIDGYIRGVPVPASCRKKGDWIYG